MSREDRQHRERVRQERQRVENERRKEARKEAQRQAHKQPSLPLSISRRQLIADFIREFRWTIIKSAPLGVFLPMSLFFGSVGPDDFSKNYAAWANTWGLTNWADWLSIYATGPRVFWGVLLVSLLYLVIAFVLPALIRRVSKDLASVVVPLIVALTVVVTIFGGYELASSGARHVSEYQRVRLKEALSPIAGNFPRALIVASMDTPEANGYAAEIMSALNFAGLKIVTGGTHGLIAPPSIMRSIGPVRGVFFQVKNIQSPPGEVLTIKRALEAANIRTDIRSNPDLAEADYLLTVANP